MSGSVRIVTSGQTLTVNITRPDGSAATAYTDGTLAATVTFPQTISSDTSFYFNSPCGLVVSTKLNGVEIAGGLNATVPVFVEDGQQRVLDPADKTPDIFGVSASVPFSGLPGSDISSLGIYLPEAHGAIGDGVADDTVAVQAALNAVPANGGRVYLSRRYLCTSGLTFSRPGIIQGLGGMNRSQVAGAALLTSSTTIDLLTCTAGGVTLTDFAIINTASSAPAAGTGVRFGAGENCTIRNVSVAKFYDNIRFDAGQYYKIVECNIADPVRYGIYLRDTENGDAGDQVVAHNTINVYSTNRAPTAALYWESGGGLKVIGNKINGGPQQPGSNASCGKFATGLLYAVADGVSTSVFTISANSIENCTSALIDIKQAGPSNTGTLSKIAITGNELSICSGTMLAVHPTSGTFSSVVIGNNTISNGSTGILAQNITGLMIGPNTFDTMTNPVSIQGGVSNDSVASQVVNGDNLIVFQTGSLNSSNTRVSQQQATMHFSREVPSTTSTTVYTTLWRLSWPSFMGGLVELTISGNVPTKGQCVWNGKRTITRGNAGNCTANTVGTDTTDGFAGAGGTVFDVLFDTAAVAGEVQVKVRLNATAGGTDLIGRALLKIDGECIQVKKGA